MKGMRASMEYLKEIYVKKVRNVLEFAVPTWSSVLTEVEKKKLREYIRQLCIYCLEIHTRTIVEQQKL
jgi:hypothetical protein